MMIQKIITIHQPDFMPWLGFFDRWIKSDLFIILDDVQFLRQGWHHRDKIKTANGSKWLTVPVKKKGKYFQTIKETEIETSGDWYKTHLNILFSAYRDAPQFDTIYSDLKTIYSKKHSRLMDLNLDLLFFAANKLAIKTPVIFSSEYNIDSKGTKRLIDLIKKADGNIYLTGTGSKAYLEDNLFFQENIKITWHKFPLVPCSQNYKKFDLGLSIIDSLMMMPAYEISNFLKGEAINADMQVEQ